MTKADELDLEQCRLNTWRINVTALSHLHNLYFVAYEDIIHVFEPQFPTQSIAAKPSLILELPKTRHGIRGHVWYAKPHSVNNLITAELGAEEVLVCVCDDGDVIAYHTNALMEAVDSLSIDPVVRPFFHANVGASAWGLSVQKDTRMIAVSANSHHITVFAFALTNETVYRSPATEDQSADEPDNCSSSDECIDTDMPWEPWPTAEFDDLQSPSFRSKNYRIILDGHSTNIPSISFYYADPPLDDSSICHHLLSTDILGHTYLWDIRQRRVVKRLVPRNNPFDPVSDGHRHRLAGWGVMQLDKRAFTKVKAMPEAFGTCTVFGRNQKLICDISASQVQVRNAGTWQTPRSPARQRSNALAVDVATEEEPAMSPGSSPSDTPDDQAGIAWHINSVDDSSDDTNDFASINAFRRDHILQMEYPILSYYLPQDEYLLPHGHDPILILQPEAIHLLQTADFSNMGPSAPVIFLNAPLHQEVEPEEMLPILYQCDRLSLHCQIPELGVVLVGSPKGRVAILTLHRFEFPPSEPQIGLDNGLVHTMRLDHILPFHSQEKEMKRPNPHLVGLAASPLQGARDRRTGGWRLMLMYSNHTILSYRIDRSPTGTLDEVLVI